MSYPCTGCGACCRMVGLIKEVFPAYDPASPFYFPYNHDATGKCEKLNDDNTCSIYESRPLICNIEKFAEATGITDKNLFYEQNIKSCNVIMDEQGVDEKYRIK